MTSPFLCWCWNDRDGTRNTHPSIRLISSITEGRGVGVNGYVWARAQRITEGHPDAVIDAALEKLYVARWKERSDVAPDIHANFAEMEAYRKEALRSWISDGIINGVATHEIPVGALVSINKDGSLCRATFEPINKPKLSALSRILAILRGR